MCFAPLDVDPFNVNTDGRSRQHKFALGVAVGTVCAVNAERLGRLIGVPVTAVRPLDGGSICRAVQVELADGRTAFAKTAHGAVPPGFFTAEVNGLRWLAEAPDGPPLPRVLGHDDDMLALNWVEEGEPTPAVADLLGRELEALHACGAEGYGAGWPGYIGSAPMDNTPAPSWAEFYATRRIEPYVQMLCDAGTLDGVAPFDRLVERLPELAGPPEPPARLHGDLWSGNVLWAVDERAYLVDPAAYGGHRETDLAMLRLFGAPHLDRVQAAYAGAAAAAGRPLADGVADRVALHQLFPLLVHAVIFGGGYVGRAVGVARWYAG
jgi:fructosamine-3-kinase